jgi:hypothetical protein
MREREIERGRSSEQYEVPTVPVERVCGGMMDSYDVRHAFVFYGRSTVVGSLRFDFGVYTYQVCRNVQRGKGTSWHRSFFFFELFPLELFSEFWISLTSHSRKKEESVILFLFKT